MTSMHSSAHSIRSMDSIRTELRTELSRLETMITNASNAHPSDIEIGESHTKPGPGIVERQVFTVAETENSSVHLSVPGPLAEHGMESSVTKYSRTGGSLHSDQFHDARSGLSSRSQSQSAGKVADEKRNEADPHIPSKENQSPVGDSDNKSSAREVNKASDLYAEFSKKLEPRRNESFAVEIDNATIHHVLRQSLASIYPAEVVKYISLRQVTTLCEDHIDFLDRRPNFQISAVGKMKERSYVDIGTRAAT